MINSRRTSQDLPIDQEVRPPCSMCYSPISTPWRAGFLAAADRERYLAHRADGLPARAVVDRLGGAQNLPTGSGRRSRRSGPHNRRRHIRHQMWRATFYAGNPHVRFDERGRKTGLRHRARLASTDQGRKRRVSRTHRPIGGFGAMQEMRVGPSRSAVRCRPQTAASCVRKERSW